MACKIFVNKEENTMLTALFDYIDNSNPGTRKVDKVIDILKENGVVRGMQGRSGVYATEEDMIQLRYIDDPSLLPGLLTSTLVTTIKDPTTNQDTNVYEIDVNSLTLNFANAVKDRNADITYSNQYELDKKLKERAPDNVGQKLTQEIKQEPLPKTYRTNAQSHDDLQKLAIEAKVIIESEIEDLKNLPEEERNKKENRLLQLQAAVKKINRVDDFYMFIVANKDTIDNAVLEFDSIMEMPRKEQATFVNLNNMYAIKEALDAVDTLRSLRKVVRDQKALGAVGRLDAMLDMLKDTIDQADILNEQFEEQIIPIMADVLIGYHNEAIDPQIDAIVNNIVEHNRWKSFESEIEKGTMFANEYKELKSKLAKKEITEQQFNARAQKMTVESFKNRKLEGREVLIREMTNAHRDKSAFSYYFDPLIYSSEAAVQLFTKSVKEATFKKNDMTRDFKGDLNEAYQDFAEGKNEENVEELYEDIIEEVDYITSNSKGERDTMKVLSLVQPTLKDKHEKNKQEFYKATAKKYNKPQREDYASEAKYKSDLVKWQNNGSNAKVRNEYNKALESWDNENSEPIDGWEKIVDQYQSVIDKQRRIEERANEAGRAGAAEAARIQRVDNEKKLSRVYNEKTGKPKGDLLKPKQSKYENPKYVKIQNDPRLKKFYDFTLKSFKEAHELVGKKRMPKNTWDEFSYLLPSIRKRDLDRLKEQGIMSAGKDMLSEGFTVVETDRVFGIYNEKTGELKKSVPVYHTKPIDAKDVSRDVASSLYLFRDMAHNFKSKNQIYGHVMLFREIMANRDPMELDSFGVAHLSQVAKKLGYNLPAKKPGESYTLKHVNDFIDTIMFGQIQLKQNVKGISLTKSVDAINAFTAMNALSFNFLQGVNQSLIDNMALVAEAAAGQFFNKKDLGWAKSQYWIEGAGLSDTGKFMPETKLGKALELFDALTEFTDQEGNRLVGGKLRKALQLGNLLVVQQAAEHEVGATRMLALMKNLEGKLKDKDGNVIMNESGNPANLYDLLVVDSKGRMSVDPRVANFNRYDFINLIQGLSRRTNQTKGSFDRPTLNRIWYGKLFMLFRSWMNPGIRKRYGHGGMNGPSIHVDEELGTVTQGTYISFWNMLRESIREKDMPQEVYGRLTDMEKQNVKRTVTDLTSLAVAGVLIGALTNIDDDEKSWASNFLLYQMLRYRAEVQQWLPFYGTAEALRILKSPTATARQIEKIQGIIEQISLEGMYNVGFPVDEKEIFYQRDTGRYNKGDRKIKKNFEDLMPLLRGLNKSGSPEDAAKYFLSGTYK